MNHGDQDDCRLLLQIGLENLLSLGPGAPPLKLESLNASSAQMPLASPNLIEALSLLRAAPLSATVSNMDLRGIVRHGGGVNEWVWKGGRGMPANNLCGIFSRFATNLAKKECRPATRGRPPLALAGGG